ncbi:MAG: hypothetical protein JWN97_1460 [Nocardioides sp.]|nr:hypothetical protein [Nocardioides sp.]
MVDTSDRRFSARAVTQLMTTARLDLPAERVEIALGMIEHFYGVMDAMDNLDVGEVSPAVTFVPTWE